MDDYTKVLVYGSFDGFAYSTDGSIAISVVLDSGEKVEIPEEFIVSADQMVNKYKIKLKDVIARIEKFDLATKAVWINEILNELGSEYGAFKYKAGYEQGKFDGAMEHEKVTVPQFVADWIEKNRGSLFGLNYDSVSSEIYDWVYEEEEEEGNLKKLHLACAIGYEVEKEKRYYVRLKGVVDNLRLLRHNSPTNTWTIGSEEQCFNVSRAHTRKELEEAGFGWVFDCPGIEIEEVEE